MDYVHLLYLHSYQWTSHVREVEVVCVRRDPSSFSSIVPEPDCRLRDSITRTISPRSPSCSTVRWTRQVFGLQRCSKISRVTVYTVPSFVIGKVPSEFLRTTKDGLVFIMVGRKGNITSCISKIN